VSAVCFFIPGLIYHRRSLQHGQHPPP
jgi:hypothetical protein